MLYNRAEKDGLLICITANPPGLMDPKGIEVTGYDLMLHGKAIASINYVGLGMAIVELG